MLRLMIVTARKEWHVILLPADGQRSVAVLQQARDLGGEPLQVALRHHQGGELRGDCAEDKIN